MDHPLLRYVGPLLRARISCAAPNAVELSFTISKRLVVSTNILNYFRRQTNNRLTFS